MRSEKLFSLIPGIILVFVLLPLFVGCSQSTPNPTTKNDAAASGGATSSGGSGGAGGVGGSSSSGGITGSGGTTASGGASGSGGVAGSGGNRGTGGTTASGGSSASGGTTSAGGTTGAGGTKATGGTTSAGGTTASGGSSGGGGTTTAGGTTGPGGTTASGGTTGKDAGSDAPAGTGGAASGGTTGTGGTTGAGGTTTCAPPTVTLSGSNAVAGTLIQFNDNGGWCWYQDERAVVDTKGNKLLIGSVASGGSRNGYIEAVIYDIAAKTNTRYTVSTALASVVDDHNAPAFVIRPDGKYFAMYSSHRQDCYSRFSIFDGTKWSAEAKYDWTPQGCPWTGASTDMITYSNPWYMGTTIYSAVRSVNTDPSFLTSTNDGASWTWLGRLTSSPQVGYVAGYFKYWGNNTDRIDFVGTEAHPRDADTSLYHGYVKGGQVFNSMDTVEEASLKDTSATTTNAADITAFTPVFKTGTTINGVKLEHAWNHDIVRYADNTIAILGQARVSGTGTDDPDKRMLYFRFDGTSWKATYLAKGGSKLYSSEQDYIGLGALVPDDPTTIYISTPYNPSTDAMGTSGKHEIWRGTTCDNGKSFQWTPVTANSTKDNIRPIVPKWDSSHSALLWMQGTYTSAQTYSEAIVGTISAP